MTATDADAQIAENRKRYEALRAAGTGNAPKSMPPPTALEGAPIDEKKVVLGETIPGGWYANYRLKAGEHIRIENIVGTAAVALLAWNATDPSERLNHADTVKIQWTAALQKGRLLFSDMGRVLLSIVEDTSGAHDVLVGGSNAAGTARKYGNDPSLRNTRTNMTLAAAKFGLGPRDIPPLATFFAPVIVRDDGSFAWRESLRQPGDFVELRAEMDLLVALSNCPHPLDPASTYAPGPVRVTITKGAPAEGEDFCRTATVEAVRAFENTNSYLGART
jgi:urea carboxylase-associated protein 2